MSLTKLHQVEIPAAHAILEILEGEGVEYIFGVPGGPLTTFFEALHVRKTIRFVLAKHEGGAAYMAAAHARVTGRLGVCCVTSGPGATNAITGIASAYADGLPVLVLTGQVATQVFGKGAIQESSVHGIDLVEIFRPFTLDSYMLPSAQRVPDLMRGAVRTAMGSRRGPVHVSMPADLLSRPVTASTRRAPQYRSASSLIDPEGLAATWSLLQAAKRPLLLAGHGVALARGSKELATLATALQLPVATTPKGKGVFPEDHPLSVGVLGFGGHQLPEHYLQAGGADLLLVVGSSLNEFVTNGWALPLGTERALVQIDVDERVIGRNYPVSLGVGGDARASLAELHRLSQSCRRPEYDREPLAALRTRTPRFLAAEQLTADDVPLKPQRLIALLREALPEDVPLFVDNGTSIIWATHYYEARRPNTYFIDLGLASMGSAVAGVIGGALGTAGRRAVALVGDAAFAMHGMEVHTAVELGLPVTWVVLNNGGHGMVYQGETLMKGTTFGTSLFHTPIDSAALANALGATGVRAASPDELRSALARALAVDERPTVIDVLVDPNEMAPTLVSRAQTLAQFFALRRRSDAPVTLAPPSTALSAPPVTLAPLSIPPAPPPRNPPKAGT